jgi:hypothetical protein
MHKNSFVFLISFPQRKTLKCQGHVKCTPKVVPRGAVPSTDSDLLTLVSLLHVNGLNRLVFGPRGIISYASIITFKIQCKSSPLPLLHFRHMDDLHSQKTIEDKLRASCSRWSRSKCQVAGLTRLVRELL